MLRAWRDGRVCLLVLNGETPPRSTLLVSDNPILGLNVNALIVVNGRGKVR